MDPIIAGACVMAICFAVIISAGAITTELHRIADALEGLESEDDE